MTTPTPSLHSAKRTLEKAVEAVTHFAFDRQELRLKHSVNGCLTGPLDDIRYFHATSANRKTFEKHVAAVLKAEPELFDQSRHNFLLLVDAARAHYTIVEKMTAEEKARLTAKRAAVKAKAEQRKELDLGDKVSLRGVDVGQYKIILAGLEPVRLHIYEATKKDLQAEFSELDAKLSAVGYEEETYNPRTKEMQYSRTACKIHQAKAASVARWFVRAPVVGYRNPNLPTILQARPNIPAIIEKTAQRAALDYIQGYAGKLAIKAGEEIANDEKLTGAVATSASVSTNNLWGNSIARIGLTGNRELVFHTQVIWNRSCLGKNFNQWPTRRIS